MTLFRNRLRALEQRQRPGLPLAALVFVLPRSAPDYADRLAAAQADPRPGPRIILTLGSEPE